MQLHTLVYFAASGIPIYFAICVDIYKYTSSTYRDEFDAVRGGLKTKDMVIYARNNSSKSQQKNRLCS